MQKFFIRQSKVQGFTLVETMLSLAIVALIASMGVPVYQSFQVKNDLNISVNTIAQSARRAQALARGGVGDSDWGVAVGGSNITLFKGTTYASRDSTYDELFDLPASITPSGMSEVVFQKFSGFPTATGSIILTTNTNETSTITINEKGRVNF